VYTQGNVNFRFGMPGQRVNVVNSDAVKKYPKLIGYDRNGPWAITKIM